MKRKQNKNELKIIMTYLVGYREKKVWFSELFLNAAKDMSSEAFREYMKIMNKTKGFEIIVIK